MYRWNISECSSHNDWWILASEDEKYKHMMLWFKSTTSVLWLHSWKSNLVQYSRLREEIIYCWRSQISQGSHGIHRNTILYFRWLSEHISWTERSIPTLYYSTMLGAYSKTDSYLSHEKPKEPSRKRFPETFALYKTLWSRNIPKRLGSMEENLSRLHKRKIHQTNNWLMEIYTYES